MINKIKDSIITIIVFVFDVIGFQLIWWAQGAVLGKILLTIPLLIIGEAIDIFLTKKLKGDK